MFVPHLRSIVAATVAVLMALAAPVAAQSTDLFTPVDATPPSGPLDDITLRSRVVLIDLGQLGRAQAAVAAPPTPQPKDTPSGADKRRAAPAPARDPFRWGLAEGRE